MSKRAVLGKGAESIFEITTFEKKEPHLKSVRLPKFKTFEVKLSILLRTDQLEFLTELERKIMRNRSTQNKKERITKNSILRAYIDVLSSVEIDKSEIRDEAELLRRLKSKLQVV
ncbi:MAG: hypothetical protein AB1422_19570, partial [bacterium]